MTSKQLEKLKKDCIKSGVQLNITSKMVIKTNYVLLQDFIADLQQLVMENASQTIDLQTGGYGDQYDGTELVLITTVAKTPDQLQAELLQAKENRAKQALKELERAKQYVARLEKELEKNK